MRWNRYYTNVEAPCTWRPHGYRAALYARVVKPTTAKVKRGPDSCWPPGGLAALCRGRRTVARLVHDVRKHTTIYERVHSASAVCVAVITRTWTGSGSHAPAGAGITHDVLHAVFTTGPKSFRPFRRRFLRRACTRDAVFRVVLKTTRTSSVYAPFRGGVKRRKWPGRLISSRQTLVYRGVSNACRVVSIARRGRSGEIVYLHAAPRSARRRLTQLLRRLFL